MKTINKLGISFAVCILAIISGVSVAHAGEVTVNYQVLPAGPILSNNVATSCTPETADTYTGYAFMFWDNQGTISWNKSVTVCPGSGNTLAIAWYLATGDCNGTCGCPPSGCFVTTIAYSIDHSVFLTDGTPIALVNPNSPPDPAWTSPSTTVNTTGPESISAESALAFPPYKAEPFRYWQQLNTTTETPIGVVFNASAGDTAFVVAFYGPDPCTTLRNELNSCLEEHLKCGAIGKALQMCEVLNREIQ
jgi:hypothetical protein